MRTLLQLAASVMIMVLALPAGARERVYVESNRDYVSRDVTKQLPTFDKVSVLGSVDVEFTVGSPRSVELYGASNVLDYVVLEVKNGRLTAGMQQGVQVRGKSRLKVIVTAPTLREISITGSGDVDVQGRCTTLSKILISGSGDVEVNNLKVSSLDIAVNGSGDVEIKHLEAKHVEAVVNGSGDVELRGSAQSAKLVVSGSGDIDAEDFVVRDVKATVGGSGDIECNCTNHLDATVSGSGEITYVGNPREVSKNSMRSSQIRRDD